MEATYLKGSLPDWVTEKVCLKQYFDNFRSLTKESFEGAKKDSARIAALMGHTLTNEQFYTLSETCSPDLLAVEGENPTVNIENAYRNPGDFEKTKIPADVKLETFEPVKRRSKIQEKKISSRLKYKNQMYINELHRKTRSDIPPGSEYIVTITVHYPYHCTGEHNNSAKRNLICSQEIVALGNDSLGTLRDVIICMEEFGDPKGDSSETPESDVKIRLRDLYRSGMFYIGNTFYIDKRHPENLDYSEVIRSWGAKRKISFNNVKVMEDTKIQDLVVRFGYPYLYQHLGNCEHILIFSDARLLHSNDIRNREQYPLFMCLSLKRAKFCAICGDNFARWVVTGSERLTRDPAFLCHSCLKGYLYKDNVKIGSFRAYRYYDRKAVM